MAGRLRSTTRRVVVWRAGAAISFRFFDSPRLGGSIAVGLVESLNRPGSNVTGATFISSSLGAKRLELARELVPNAGVIGLLCGPNNPDALEELRNVQDAAKAIAQQLLVVTASSDRDFTASRPAPRQGGPRWDGSISFQRNDQVIALAARHKLPTVYISGDP